MKIVIETDCRYDIFQLTLIASNPGIVDATHGMYKLSKGTHFIIDENHDISQYKEEEE